MAEIKIAAKSVADIKARAMAGESVAAIAKEYAVPDKFVRDVRDGKAWAFVAPAVKDPTRVIPQWQQPAPRETKRVRLSRGIAANCPQVKDLLGRRFGKLVVTERLGVVEGQRRWNVRCDCGGIKTVRGCALVGGNTRSCGCGRGESPMGLRINRSAKLAAVTK